MPTTRNIWLAKRHLEILGNALTSLRVIRCVQCGYEVEVSGPLTVCHPVFDKMRHCECYWRALYASR